MKRFCFHTVIITRLLGMSGYIRPKTIARKYIDPDWAHLLQMLPYPKYVKRHFVISAASAEVLSHFFGDRFSFKDSTETTFRLPVRNFSSFRQASDKDAFSRFYRGIHFTDAIWNGQASGKKKVICVEENSINQCGFRLLISEPA